MNSEEEEWSGEEMEWRCKVEGEEVEEEPVTVGRRRRGGTMGQYRGSRGG